MLKEVEQIIAISHLNSSVKTTRSASKNPAIFPKSPLADHIPITHPYSSTLKCSLTKVSKIGHAEN
jgi:hypothetical protein